MTVHHTIIEAIESWDPLEDPTQWPEARFEALARQVFAHQYEHDEPYRDFCAQREISPGTLSDWRAIPAVPTEVFKHVELFGGDEVVRTFRTSGTTQGARGAHRFETLEVYRASLHPPFVRFCNPGRRSLRVLVVAPPPDVAPDSSLSFMLGELVERWGDDESAFFFGDDAEALHRSFEALDEALTRACRQGVPVALLGTAFGYAEFFATREQSWELPEGSRLMETGGFKGSERALERDQLYELFARRLGLDPRLCISEYSMTELSSQAYTDSLWRWHDSGRPTGDEVSGGVLQTPPWARVELVDPMTLAPLDDPDAIGLICWYDLANIDSVLAVQTSDRGRRVVRPDGARGFELLGRAPDAQLRGCSLTVEEILQG